MWKIQAINDLVFLVTTLSIIAFTAFGWRYCRLEVYNRCLSLCVLLSVSVIVGFNEFEVERVGISPIHAGLMALCQYGALTLAAKIWFSINYIKLGTVQKVALSLFVHGALIGLVVASYWLKKSQPLLPILMYPLASISLALLAETIEEHLHQ